MDPFAAACLAVIGLATAGCIEGERRDARGIIWATKPVASAAFVALGFGGASGGALGLGILAALVLSFFGDLLLIPSDRRIFRASILTFLLAHVAFVAAFLGHGASWGWTAAALVPLALSAALIGRWLLPHVAAALKPAVLAYMVVISAMVAAAAGAVGAGATPWLLAAGIAFYANDVLVARDRFVTRTWLHRLVGLPLYYGAMAAFALIAST